MYKVLIVEDDIGYQIIYKKMEAWNKCGFLIAGTADHGGEALRMMEKERFDFIFSDIKMPLMDGIDMLKSIRERGDTTTPVAFASSFEEFSFAKQGILYGLFDYVLKPVDEKVLENLLKRVGEYLDGRENKIDATVVDLLDELGIKPENDDFIYQVCTHFSEHFKEPFSLSDFSAIFGYSNNHFGQLFQHHFNMSFKEFANRVKVAYAIEYLKLGTYSVGQISEILGFSKVDYFREVFKGIKGVRPIDYKFGTKGETNQ